MTTPRLVLSLVHLRDQVNAASQSRSKTSDGWIGDTSHQAHKSDHNPDENGLVYALDITNDPMHGVISHDIADALRLSKDARLQYVISNGMIANMDIQDGAWRKYNGPSPHDHHCHVSVRHPLSLADNVRDWKLPSLLLGQPGAKMAPKPPVVPRPAVSQAKPAKKTAAATTAAGAVVAGTVGYHASVAGYDPLQIFFMVAGIGAVATLIFFAIRKARSS